MPKHRKPTRKAKEQQAWYAWALHFRDSDPEVRRLSPDAREGLQSARSLARNALERSEAAPDSNPIDQLAGLNQWDEEDEPTVLGYRLEGGGNPYGEPLLPALLTPADLAEHWETAQDVEAKIEAARVGLFGKDLSRSGIYYRLKQRAERGPRTCDEPDCSQAIPAHAHGGTRYCRAHGSGAARARRLRKNRTAGSSPGGA